MPQISAQQVINEARKYLDVRYASQGRDARYGIDCGGLIILVCRALGVTDVEHLGYSNSPDGIIFEKLLQADLEEITPKSNVQLGDIVACDYGDGIQHTAIVSVIDSINDRITIIHAKRDKGVVESYLHGRHLRAWTKTFRIKGIINEENA